jgi:hypothetical protein
MRMLMPAALVALALTGTGCGGGGIGAVNSMPSNATDKSMQKAGGSFSDLVGGGGGSSSGAGACESSLPSGVADDVREGARKCDNGEQKFCHAIAFWYLKGNGGKERRVDGVKWFKHACERGYQPSCEAIETIKRKLEEMKAQGKI